MTGGVSETFSRRCPACGWWARRAVDDGSCRACGASMTGGRSSSGREARPDLGAELVIFLHRRRCGTRAATLRARDVFGVELADTPTTRRAIAADLRELAATLDAHDASSSTDGSDEG